VENLEQAISIRHDYVLVERPSEYRVVLSKQARDLLEISAACNKSACKKVLVLGPKTKISLSAFDIMELGEEIAKHGLQMAFADVHDASSDAMSLLEITVSRRGGAIKFFDSVTDAENWLEITPSL
jgi:hypothetical protein